MTKKYTAGVELAQHKLPNYKKVETAEEIKMNYEQKPQSFLNSLEPKLVKEI